MKVAVQQVVLVKYVCVSSLLKYFFKRFTSQSNHSLRLTDQYHGTVLNQLSQLLSAVQFKTSNVLLLFTPFHIYHNIIHLIIFTFGSCLELILGASFLSVKINTLFQTINIYNFLTTKVAVQQSTM